jgi:hypothetical protein
MTGTRLNSRTAFDWQSDARAFAEGRCGADAAASAALDPGPGEATYECSACILIPMLAGEMRVSVAEEAGQMDKRTKALYGQTCGAAAAQATLMRETMFRGKPFHENICYACDKALLQRAMREVMSGR